MKIKILSGILLISGVSFFYIMSWRPECDTAQPVHQPIHVDRGERCYECGKWSIYSIPFRFSDLLNIYGEMRSNWYESGR